MQLLFYFEISLIIWLAISSVWVWLLSSVSFYCVQLCNHWLVSYVDPLSNPLLKLLSIWASLNHCWPHALHLTQRILFTLKFFFSTISWHHKICLLVSQYWQKKGSRMKIGCEGGLMGQNTPTQSDRQKLHKFTFDPLNEVENPIKTLPWADVLHISPIHLRLDAVMISWIFLWQKCDYTSFGGVISISPVIYNWNSLFQSGHVWPPLQLPRKQIYAKTFLTDPFLASLDQEWKSTSQSRQSYSEIGLIDVGQWMCWNGWN